MSRIEIEDLYALGLRTSLTDDERRDRVSSRPSCGSQSAFLLVKHLDDCRQPRRRDHLLPARPQADPQDAAGTTPKQDGRAGRPRPGRRQQSRSDGVVDIFKVAGIDRPDISILDDKFLQTFKDRPHENLRLKLLEKLLADEIRRRQPRNLAQAKSFRELLEKTLQRYHKRLIDAAAVVAEMVRMQQEMDATDDRARQLGLTEEELAFYDAVADNAERVYDQPFLRDLVHDVVQTIKRNLKVDWTEPHRDDVRAEIRAAVKRVLRKREVREADFEPFIARFIQQAEAQYAEWPLVA